MISAFRLDSGRVITLTHPPGTKDEPYIHALGQLRLHLIAAGYDLADTIYAPYQYGTWITSDKEP